MKLNSAIVAMIIRNVATAPPRAVALHRMAVVGGSSFSLRCRGIHSRGVIRRVEPEKWRCG